MNKPTTTRWTRDDIEEADAIAAELRRATGQNVSRSDVLRRAARQGFALLRAEVQSSSMQRESTT